MKFLSKTWNAFKAQPEIWFFYAFLLTFPLSIRKVLIYFPVTGSFNEYLGTYFYLSDVLLLLTLGIWIISTLYNKINNSSITTAYRVPRGTFLYLIAVLAIFIIWSFISIAWSSNQDVAFYRSLKLFELYLLYLFIALNSKCSMWNILRHVFGIIIAIGAINALIGMAQFFVQHSIGLFWLKESLISPEIPGVAKIIAGGHRYIRAYGLFPHPNIFGGFLLISIILTYKYRKIFYSDKNKLRSTKGTKMFHVEHFSFYKSRFIWAVLLVIQMAGEVLTFSKSAILGLLLAFSYIYWDDILFFKQKSSMWNIFKRKQRLFYESSVESKRFNFYRLAIFSSIIAFLAIYLIKLDFYAFFIQSLKERLFYLKIAFSMIFSNFLAGIGMGQFTLKLLDYSNQNAQLWQLQPVHNIPLLILAELGLIGFSLFIWFLWHLFHVEQSASSPGVECSTRNNERCEIYSLKTGTNVPRETNNFKLNVSTTFKAILAGFILISLFDHYLWDIQQGQIMLWLFMGLLANTATFIDR